jgi:protein O-mannosyl-transferase
MEANGQAASDAPQPSWLRGCGRARVALPALCLLTLLAHGNGLRNGFTWDDYHLIVTNGSLRDLRNLPRFFTEPATATARPDSKLYRPLRTTLSAIVYRVCGLDPRGHHAAGLLFHLANVTIVFFLLRRLGSAGLALAAAAVFAVHPLTTEAVASGGGLYDLMYGCFFLLAVLLHLKLRAGAAHPERLAGGVYLCHALALLSKEAAVVLPLALLLFDLCVPVPPGAATTAPGATPWSRRRFVLHHAALWALSAAFLLLRATLLDTAGMAAEREGVTFARAMAMQATVVARYLQLLVAPVGLSARHVVPIPEAALDPAVLVSLVVIAALVALAVLGWRRDRLITFAIGWFFVGLLPVMNLVPLRGSMMGERFCYVPMIMLVFLVARAAGTGLLRLGRAGRGWVPAALGVALVAIAVPATHARTAVWRDDVTLLEDVVRKAPDAMGARSILIEEYARLRRPADVRRHQEANVASARRYRDLYDRMGDRALGARRPEEAATWYVRALQVDRRDPHARQRLRELAAQLPP